MMVPRVTRWTALAAVILWSFFLAASWPRWDPIILGAAMALGATGWLLNRLDQGAP